MIPLLVGLLAVVTIVVAPGVTVFSMAVVLPAAFRIWMVLCPAPHSLDGWSCSASEEGEPIYRIVAPLRGEARGVDQLLTAIERLNYPAEKLDVIIAAEANDEDTRAAITARKHRISHHGHSRPVLQTRYEAQGTERSASFCSRHVHRNL